MFFIFIPGCSPFDLLTQEAEIDSLKTTIKNHEASIETLKAELDKKDVFISELTERLRRKSHLSVTTILERKNLKGLFKFYTGLSQCYSDYKSSTTLKCLIGCDPNGSITFVSELFTGAISDKSISEESGFYELLKELIQKGYVKKGDAVMADKGFTIEKELTELGLKLNIPPHASSSCQMSAADTELTQKIAKHRIHIERLIAKVKKFRIVAHTIPMNLFQTINQIWSVVCLLTLFQDTFVKDKEN